MNKICSTCHISKPLNEFHKDKNRPLGIKYRCKACYGVRPKSIAKSNLQKKLINPNGKRSILKTYMKEGFYEKHKHLYQDQLKAYESAPTGKAYIGLAKEPLMPNKTGFGFQGIVTQDEDRKLVQCNNCGKWAKIIGSIHLQKCAGQTVAEYKKKYGLNASTGLVSDETSMMLTKNALLNKATSTRWDRTSKPRYDKGLNKTVEYENKYGTCPLQLKTRLYEFIRNNKELPGPHNRGQSIYKALRRRYRDFAEALEVNGLPSFIRQGTNMLYTFPDKTTHAFNINKMHDREALYQKIEEKCPAFATHAGIILCN